MGYKVSIEALDGLFGAITLQANDWLSRLESLNTAVEGISASQNVKGSAAENIKQYVSSVHGTIISSLEKLISLHSSNFLLYKQDYQQSIDADLHAIICEEELNTIKNDLKSIRDRAVSIDGELQYTLQQIRDIFCYTCRDISDVDAAHKSAEEYLTDLDDRIKALEQSHLSSDFKNTGQMISSLNAFIADAAGTIRSYKSSFTPESIICFSSYQGLQGAQVSIENELNEKAESIEVAYENEGQRFTEPIEEDAAEAVDDTVITVGNTEYRLGDPEEPYVAFDHDYEYDPDFSPTADDYLNWIKWGTLLHGAEALNYMPDGCATYERYRSGSGKDMTIDYEKAYRQDENVKKTVDVKMEEGVHAALRYYAQTNDDSFSLTGGATGIAAYPCTENWQKAIGGHQVWNSMDVTVSGSTMTINITVHELDRYNFDKGKSDITTGTKDDVNGRFESAGWAKSFTTRGTVERTITVNLDEVDLNNVNWNSDAITVEGGSRERIGEGENR